MRVDRRDGESRRVGHASECTREGGEGREEEDERGREEEKEKKKK